MARHEEKKRTLMERNKFFSTTNISGFGLIQSSNSRIEIIAWYVVIIVFAALTIRNIVNLTEQFRHQSPITVVSMATVNRTTQLKPLLISLTVAWPSLNPQYRDTDHSSQFNYNISLKEEFEAALESLDSKEKTLNRRWPYVLMPLMARHCLFMSYCEQFRYCQMSYLKDGIEFIQRFFKHGRKFGIEFHQLHQTFGYQVMNWTGFSHSESWRNFTFLLTCQGNLSRTEHFLEVLPPRATTKTFLGDLIFEYNSPMWFLKFDLSPLFTTFTKLLNQSYVEIENWYLNIVEPSVYVIPATAEGTSKKAPITAKFKELKLIWLEIYSSFHAVGRCSTPVEHLHCFNHCSGMIITKLGGCLSLIWESELFEDYEWCSPEQYMNCLHHQKRHLEIERKCIESSCVQHCDRYVTNLRFSSTRVVQSSMFGVYITGTGGLEYPQIQQVYGQSWESYWAELGGTFDFWLGASVIGGVHLILYIIKQIVYAFRKNTKTGKRMQEIVGKVRNKEPIAEMKTSLTMAISTKKQVDVEENENEISLERILQIEHQLKIEKRKREELEEELKEKISQMDKLIVDKSGGGGT